MNKSVVILLCILNIFLFNSCKDKNKSTFSPQLEYISISCNHSNYNYCYSFTVYTKDSKAYFSADCTIDNFEFSGKHIEFENKEIAYNEFLKIQNFARKNNLYNLYSNHKDIPYDACDITTYSITTKWENQQELTISDYSFDTDIQSYLYLLAKKYCNSK